MSKFEIGYNRPIGDLSEHGAILKLRQDARIIGQPQGDSADPERKNWVVRIKDNQVKIYSSIEEATEDEARGPVRNPTQAPPKSTRRINTITPVFRTIHAPTPTNMKGGRISSPLFHQDDEHSRIRVTEENLASAQASYSEFEHPLSDDQPKHVKERFAILKSIAAIKVKLAEEELRLARFDERRDKESQIKELQEQLSKLNEAES